MSSYAIVNPGTHPELLELAKGLTEADHTVSYCSASYYGQHALARSVWRRAAPGRDLGQEGFSLRAVPFCLEAAFQGSRRFLPNGLSSAVLRLRKDQFSRSIGRWAETLDEPDVVVAQMGVARESFREWPNSVHVLNAPIAHPVWGERYLRMEAEQNPNWAAFVQSPASTQDLRDHFEEEVRQANFILVASNFSKRTFTEFGVSASKLIVCPLGATPPATVPTNGPPPGSSLRLLFAGQVNQRKGISYLLDALPTDLPYEFTLAGPILPQVAHRIGQHGPHSILGSVTQHEMFRQFSEHHVTVLPSLLEGFGLTALESMAVGTPCITSTNSFASDLIKQGQNGWVVPARDSSELAGILRTLAADPDSALEMRARAAESAASHTWAAYRSKVTALVTSLRSPGSLHSS